jgi:hypothetical protein
MTSCDKGDIEIRKMTRGDGIWSIESIKYDTFDVSGTNVVSTYTWSNVGELTFFSSPTTNALYDHHLVVAAIFDTSGAELNNPGDVYYDGDRMHFGEDPDANHNFPDFLEGTWTVLEDKRREKVLTFHEVTLAGVLSVKRTMTLKQ